MPGLYREAVTQSDVKPIGQPSVEITAVPGLSDDAEELVFTAEVDVRPEITLPDLSEVTITVDDVEVTDEDVETELNNLGQRFATLVEGERAAADGDCFTLD